MSVTFGGNMPPGFAVALREHVYTLQVRALPQVEWVWRFFPLAGGKDLSVEIKIPARRADQFGGWDEGKLFSTEVPADAYEARVALSKWFDGIHARFRKATEKRSVDDVKP